jgi:AcrR family transcriptional regulator
MTTKAETTRSQIVHSAFQLFLEKGYSATSMRDIVAASGVTMGGIYNHFSGKEAIFDLVFQENQPIRRALPSIMQAEGDTLERLIHDAARRMVKTLGDQPDVLKLMFIEIVEFQGRHMAEAIAVGYPEVMQLVSRFTVFEGQIRSIPPFTLARSFIGLFFAFFMTTLILPAQFQNQEQDLEQFVNIYLHGILE